MSQFTKKVRVNFELETRDIVSMIAILEANFEIRRFQYEVLEQ
jgi:hypothetical protein